jgi:hypothetical protein
VVCIFARQTSEPLASLVKKIDAAIAKNDDLKSFVVVLTDKADDTAKTLKTMAQDCRLKNVPLTIVDNPAGPPSYKIAQDADVTVMMWKDHQVKVNHVYKTGGLTQKDVDTLIAELPKILND